MKLAGFIVILCLIMLFFYPFKKRNKPVEVYTPKIVAPVVEEPQEITVEKPPVRKIEKPKVAKKSKAKKPVVEKPRTVKNGSDIYHWRDSFFTRSQNVYIPDSTQEGWNNDPRRGNLRWQQDRDKKGKNDGSLKNKLTSASSHGRFFPDGGTQVPL